MRQDKSRKVLIYKFDEHHMAFYYWHKAKHEGDIKEPLDLFHVDAHGDMSRVEKFKKSIYIPNSSHEHFLRYYRDFAKNELNIGNFIYPAVLSGVVKNVYFVFPEWRNYRSQRKRLTICSAFGEGKILKYGIRVKKNSDQRVLKAYPDIKYFNYSAGKIDQIPQGRKVILDIDLDYFACIDSILNHISYELEITKEQFQKRDLILKDKTLPFGVIRFDFFERDKKYCVRIEHKKGKEVSHLPTEAEIDSEIDVLVNTLQDKNTKPAVVTVCWSNLSGYCPEDYCRFIENSLIKKLKPLLQP